MTTVVLRFTNLSANAVLMFASMDWLYSCMGGSTSWQFDEVELKPLAPGNVPLAMEIAAVAWDADATSVRAGRADADLIKQRMKP